MTYITKKISIINIAFHVVILLSSRLHRQGLQVLLSWRRRSFSLWLQFRLFRSGLICSAFLTSICVLATVSASKVPSSDSPEGGTSGAETVARTQIQDKNALQIRPERKRRNYNHNTEVGLYLKKKLTREIQNNAQRWHLSVANCPIGNQLSIKLTGGDQKFTPICTPKRYQFYMYPMRYQNYPDSSQFRFKHPWWSQIKNFNTKKVQHIYIRVPSGAGGRVNFFYLLVFAVNKVQNQTKQAKQYSKTGQNIENNSYTGTVL